MSYLNIDDILAEEQKLSCKFLYNAYNLGQLEEGSADTDIEKGTKIDLPYWLAYVLAKKGLVSAEMPTPYQQDFKDKLIADPNVISMRSHQYYDKIGTMLSSFFSDRSLNLLLFRVFRDRFLKIYNQSLNLRETDITKIVGNMTRLERNIFENGYRSSIDYDKWRNRKGEKIERNPNIIFPVASRSSSVNNSINSNNINSSSTQSSSSSTQSSQPKKDTVLKKRKRIFDDES
ncbi:hypothetical protein DICPUDRAFT_94329 [Dictyostelium purpureum]|uniref:Uncharacterized protein n=1 Tax=Dictyostelium purpureum TaxID=5786 RepID=F0ZI80_DICPU|nr:uncharacterized protein DICPUDRAFT_94329 [Dictyostelium purpureum]EGC36359.1 hypothetical protein DICPUDRAFT_94329 [Dictyostelium purpureum]|eukprot:XP_003287113.1 hypothetical protein DICPUDRAFT_94329 [Dictyostelium purpureum]